MPSTPARLVLQSTLRRVIRDMSVERLGLVLDHLSSVRNGQVGDTRVVTTSYVDGARPGLLTKYTWSCG